MHPRGQQHLQQRPQAVALAPERHQRRLKRYGLLRVGRAPSGGGQLRHKLPLGTAHHQARASLDFDLLLSGVAVELHADRQGAVPGKLRPIEAQQVEAGEVFADCSSDSLRFDAVEEGAPAGLQGEAHEAVPGVADVRGGRDEALGFDGVDAGPLGGRLSEDLIEQFLQAESPARKAETRRGSGAEPRAGAEE